MDEKCASIAQGLRQELEHGAKELSKEVTSYNAENAPPNGVAVAVNTSTTTNEENNNHTSKPRSTVIVQAKIVESDLYEHGRVFEIKVRKKAFCWVGRSSSKKFRNNGISLSKDLEVSTTHGKFSIEDGLVYYTDTGSTNGSKINGKSLEEDEPYLIESGMTLLVGATKFQLTLR